MTQPDPPAVASALPDPLPETQRGLALVQAHIAEYQALTSRCTYWITLQYALWPILFILLGVVAEVWKLEQHRSLLTWIAAYVVLLVAVEWYHAGLEIYNNVSYLERVVRPRLKRLLAETSVWDYELYQARLRRTGILWWEWWVLVGALLALSVIIWLRWPFWSLSDWLGLFFALLEVTFLISSARGMVRTRRHFESLLIKQDKREHQ